MDKERETLVEDLKFLAHELQATGLKCYVETIDMAIVELSKEEKIVVDF